MKVTKISALCTLSAVLGLSGMTVAGDNPFGMQVLDQGYQVAEADTKAKDGKCGEGKCGGKADTKTDTKTKDGKCGEGKCGGAK